MQIHDKGTFKITEDCMQVIGQKPEVKNKARNAALY